MTQSPSDSSTVIPAELGPKLSIDLSDQKLLERLTTLRDEEMADWTRKSGYRAPEIASDYPDVYTHVILTQLITTGEAYLWAISRSCGEDDGSIGSGFNIACDMIIDLDGVVLTRPSS